MSQSSEDGQLHRHTQRRQQASKLRDTRISRFMVRSTATGSATTPSSSRKRPRANSIRRRLATNTGSKPLRVGSDHRRTAVPTERPTFTWRDVKLTHDQVMKGVKRARTHGVKTMHYVYRPAEWWRMLYKINREWYYDQRYCTSIGVFCTVCENEGEPFKCAGWDENDLAEVNESNRATWVCKHCRGTERERVKNDPF